MKLEKKPCPCGFKGINGNGCSKFLVPPLINTVENSLTSEEADELIEMAKDSERLKWMLDWPSKSIAFQFQKRNKRIEWIDKQMEKK